ncbi:putative winged helix-like DNA-binding domain superfamily, Snf8/Vps36 family [Arabidopsis thaliana]
MTFVRILPSVLNSMKCVLTLVWILLLLTRVSGLSSSVLVTSTMNLVCLAPLKKMLLIFGVQIIEVCMITRSHNGGLISLQELCNHLRQRRKKDREAVTEDDCLRAISKLKVLGSGFEVITIGKKKLVRTVPTELNKDHN